MLKTLLIACSFILFFTIGVTAADLSQLTKIEGFVKIQDTLNANKNKPFECANYVAASNSCGAISTSKIDGDSLIAANRILLISEPQIEMQIKARFDLVHGLACSSPSAWNMVVVGDAVTPELEKVAIDALRNSLEKFGKLCIGYFEVDGQLQTVNFSAETGKRIEDIASTNITFWETAPTLRAAEQT